MPGCQRLPHAILEQSESYSLSASCHDAAPGPTCDAHAQVQRTTDNIAEAGRTAWSTARTTTNRALATPRTLLNAFGGRKAPYRLHSKPGEQEWEDEEGQEEADREGLQQALLQGKDSR